MAAAFVSFSIREYASSMRNVDIGKCWPFDEKDISKSLPPISCPMFRWWFNELEIAKSHTPTKGKLRKRSIVELFDVLPQIEVTSDDNNGDDDEEERDNVEDEDDRVVLATLRKKGKKKKNRPLEKCTLKEEGQSHEPMLCHKDTSQFHKEPVCRKPFEKTSQNYIDPSSQNLPTVKNVSNNCNSIDIHITKLNSEQQEINKFLPAHGILKNQTTTTSAKIKNVTVDGQDNNLSKSGNELVKHVTFSTMHLPSSSDTNDLKKGESLSCSTKGGQVVSEDGVTNVIEERGGFTSEKKHSNDSGNHSNPPLLLNNGFEPVDVNSSMQIYGNSNGADSYSGRQQILIPTSKEGTSCNVGMNAEGSIRTSIAQNLPISTASNTLKSDLTCSQTAHWSFTSQPLGSCSMGRKASEGKSEFSIDTNICFIRDTPGSQQKCRERGESKLASGTIPICREKCDENFIGLPLNSQGELIKLHSSDDFGFNVLLKNQKGGFPVHNFTQPTLSEFKCKNPIGIVRSNYSHSPLYQKDQLKWSVEPYCLANRGIISGLCSTESQYDCVKDQNQFGNYYPNPGKFSVQSCRDLNHASDWGEMERFRFGGSINQRNLLSSRPTVRLMGKNVTVGETSSEHHGIWRDKEIFTKGPSYNQQFLQQQQVAFGVSERNQFQPSVAPDYLCFPGIQSRPVRTPFDCHQQCISSNNISSATRDLGSVVHGSSCPLYPRVAQNNTHRSIPNLNSMMEYVPRGSHISAFLPHPQNACQPILLNPTLCKCSQSICYDTSPAFPASIPNHNRENFAESFLASPTRHTPQWSMNLNEHRNQKTCSCSDSFSRHHSHPMSGNDLPLPSSYPISAFSFPIFNSNDPALSNTASLAQPSLVPTSSTGRSTSKVNDVQRNIIENRNGINMGFSYFGGAHNANLSRKRPADRSDEFMRSGNKPNLRSHLDLCPPIKPRMIEEFQPNPVGYENKITDHQKDRIEGFKTPSLPGSLKHCNESRPSVVRLRAGAKHIFRPSEDMITGNARPVHSTTTSGIGTSSEKAPVSLNKTIKIYSF